MPTYSVTFTWGGQGSPGTGTLLFKDYTGPGTVTGYPPTVFVNDTPQPPITVQLDTSAAPGTEIVAYLEYTDTGTGTYSLAARWTCDFIVPAPTQSVSFTSTGALTLVAPSAPPPTASLVNRIDDHHCASSDTALLYTTTNATSAVLTYPDGSTMGLTPDTSGTVAVPAVNGAHYVLDAYGPGGHAQASVTLSFIVSGLPSGTLVASPTFVPVGTPVTLTYTTLNAVYASITADHGPSPLPVVGSSGTLTVYPAVTTVYVLSVSDPCGFVSSSATVTVGAKTFCCAAWAGDSCNGTAWTGDPCTGTAWGGESDPSSVWKSDNGCSCDC